jgi:hypothetical protein
VQKIPVVTTQQVEYQDPNWDNLYCEYGDVVDGDEENE